MPPNLYIYIHTYIFRYSCSGFVLADSDAPRAASLAVRSSHALRSALDLLPRPPSPFLFLLSLPLSLSRRLLSGVRFCCLEITSPTPARVWVSSFSALEASELLAPPILIIVGGGAAYSPPASALSLSFRSALSAAPAPARALLS